MRNAFDRLISRLDTDEERISIFEDKSIEIAQSEMQREKRVGRNQITHQTAVDNIQKSLCIIGISKGKRRESEKEILEEIMANNCFSKANKDTIPHTY